MSDDSDYQRMARLIMNSGKKPQTEPLTSKDVVDLLYKAIEKYGKDGNSVRSGLVGLLVFAHEEIKSLRRERETLAKLGHSLMTGGPSDETGEGVCKEALGRIAAGTYTESGAEQHAKDILKALGMLEAPAQKANSCAYCEAGMQKVKEDLHYDATNNSSHPCTMSEGEDRG